jgi:hypothetical protein
MTCSHTRENQINLVHNFFNALTSNNLFFVGLYQFDEVLCRCILYQNICMR